MHHFSVNWWSSNGQPSPQTSSPNNTSNVESLKQLYHVPNSLGLQISDDSSVQSLGPPHHEIGKIWQSSQDQCFSTEPSQNESHGKDVEPQVKSVLSLSKPDLGYNPPIVDYAPSMDHFPYHCVDPCFGGLFPGYWPQALVPVNSQMVGIPPARVPLPADVSENGPIYVNAKQYHGILRRRQFRAKLEAENKLIKNRKPYLHESRHIHALNRVRGSGGRFISTKKVQPDSAPTTGSQRAADSIHMHMDRRSMLNSGNNYAGSKDFVMQNATCLEMGNIPKSDAIFQHPDGRFSSISSSHSGGVLQCSGGQMRSATHQSASVVQ